MKTRAIKFLLPVMAIVFAIAASAFTALETPNADGYIAIDGYIPTGDPDQPCEFIEEVECQLTGNQDCTYGSFPSLPVYDDTMCSLQLSRINP